MTGLLKKKVRSIRNKMNIAASPGFVKGNRFNNPATPGQRSSKARAAPVATNRSIARSLYLEHADVLVQRLKVALVLVAELMAGFDGLCYLSGIQSHFVH